MKSKKTIILITVLLSSIFLSSCNRKIGTGLILWTANENQIKNGSVVNIYEESKIRRTYLVVEAGSKEKVEIDTWRIKFFEKEKEAVEASKLYSPYFNSFAFSNKQGLPIRAEESTDSERVYKLREGQEIKVIGRSTDKVEIGRFTGYWYNVLTDDGDDGVMGYVFDYYLTVYSMNDQEKVIENARDNSDPRLDRFLANVWRPSYFNDMITKNNIDLSSFRDSYSFYIDPEKKEIHLRSNNKNIIEKYTEITRFGAKQYDFKGTSFRVTVVSEDFASVKYTYNSKDISEAYVIIEDNISEIVSGELARRDKLLKEFIEKGSIFNSNSYGSISLDSSGVFTWNNIEELISQKIISSSSEPQGRVEFTKFLDSMIKNLYSGVITFNFRNGSSASFLYSYTDTGVNFIFVPERFIKNKIITTDQFFDPVWINFEFSGKEGL